MCVDFKSESKLINMLIFLEIYPHSQRTTFLYFSLRSGLDVRAGYSKALNFIRD